MNIVRLKSYRYPVILRVVLHGKVAYRTVVAECKNARVGFTLDDLILLFSVRVEDDWFDEAVSSLSEAKSELARKISELAGGATVEREGFFVTVRPRHGEFMVQWL